jgi:hypothetical protein
MTPSSGRCLTCGAGINSRVTERYLTCTPNAISRVVAGIISRVVANGASRVSHTSDAVEGLIFRADQTFQGGLKSCRADLQVRHQRHLQLVAPAARTGSVGSVVLEAEAKTQTPRSYGDERSR